MYESHSPDEINLILSQNFRALRKQLGLSQKVLADTLGITFQQVQKHETNKNRIPIASFIILSKHYGVPLEKLFEGVIERDDLIINFEHVQAELEEKIPPLVDELQNVACQLIALASEHLDLISPSIEKRKEMC